MAPPWGESNDSGARFLSVQRRDVVAGLGLSPALRRNLLAPISFSCGVLVLPLPHGELLGLLGGELLCVFVAGFLPVLPTRLFRVLGAWLVRIVAARLVGVV